MTNDNSKYYSIGEYTFNEVQLQEFIDSGIRGDTQYCRAMQEMWKVQQSERLRPIFGDADDQREAKRQIEIQEQKITNGDD